MRALALATASIVLVFSGLASGGCSSSSAGVTCSPGQTLMCSCNGSLSGTTMCDSTGHEGPCQCGAGSGSSSGSSSSGGSASSGSGSSSGSSSGGGTGEGGSGGDATVDGAGGVGDGGAG